MDDEDNLPPLKIKCRSTDCAQGLHCFLRTKRQRAKVAPGSCYACGEHLVDMVRVHQRSLGDVQHTFEVLKRELVRHHFWHVPIDQRALNHARRKGRTGIRAAADRRLRTSIGRPDNPYDGRQTPYAGNVLYYAQHAVAACCRKCIEEWHGIPRDRELTDDERSYLTELVCRYVDHRLPDLSEEGEHVPPILRRAAEPIVPDSEGVGADRPAGEATGTVEPGHAGWSPIVPYAVAETGEPTEAS